MRLLADYICNEAISKYGHIPRCCGLELQQFLFVGTQFNCNRGVQKPHTDCFSAHVLMTMCLITVSPSSVDRIAALEIKPSLNALTKCGMSFVSI